MPASRSDFHRDCADLVGPMLRAWMDELPGRQNLRFVISTFEGCDWLRIDGIVPVEPLSGISADLGTEIVKVYAFLDHNPSFGLVLYDRGRTVRKLTLSPERLHGRWSEVMGEEQPWERDVFFAAGDLARCVRHAFGPEQSNEWQNICAHRSLLLGAQFPWASDPEVLDRLRAALSLPWLDSDFLTKRATVITSSSPERSRRWWKLV